MATYKILYWQEVPTQIKAEDDEEEVTLPLPARFMERVDRLAQQRGLHGSEDYLAQWHWSDGEDRDGSAREVAEALIAEFESKADW
jgi:hypothetical protein